MKLRTSYFNGTVLRKDITRFAPVWSLYTVFLLLLLSTIYVQDSAGLACDIPDILSGMVYVNFFYGAICATMLFGDLFNPRMCNALHAMPLRRDGWFLTHLVSGLLFSIVPNLLATALLCLGLQGYFYMGLLWLAVVVLQFLFFFGVGIFSVMCAGNRLAMAAMYLIINLFSMLVYVLADQFYEPLLYGIHLETDIYEFFCPLLSMTGACYINFSNGKIEGGRFEGLFFDEWQYLFGAAAIGILLLVVSLLLYRRRKLETAGDFIALRPLKPVFLIIYTLAVGVFMYTFTDIFGISSPYLFMAVGIIVGFFTGRMLLERTVRVFKLKSFLGFAVFAILLGASLFATKLDPLGITWYIPETEEIEFMRVYRNNDAYLYGDPDTGCYQLDSPEEINQFRLIHAQLQNERDSKNGSTCQVTVLYQCKDGKSVFRYYYIDATSAVYDDLETYFSSPEYIFNTEDIDRQIEITTGIGVDINSYYYENSDNVNITDPVFIRQLIEAMILDCEQGSMAQDYTFHSGEEEPVFWLCMDTMNPYAQDGDIHVNFFRDLTIFSCCTNTIECIEQYLSIAD